ncbi:MAG: hypothetical protein KAT85_09755 [candidate division Zixibacteria bacterium]|nr:hypothetical protein [candidate division Zixibacteria bacterium]
MRRLIIVILLVSVLLISIAPYALAGKKKAAGECVGDSMYVDNKFGFSFVKPSDWKFQEVYKDKDIERVVIVQKSAPVPPQFTGQKKGYFTRPQLTVLAMETDQRPKDYVEFLLAEKGKDDLKKKAYNMFQLLRQDTEYVFQKKKTRKIKVGGKYGVKVVGRRQYYFAFEDDLRPLSDFISGYIFVIGGDDSVVLMEFVCEREMAKSLEPDLDMIIDGFSFASEEPEPEPEPTEDQGDGN